MTGQSYFCTLDNGLTIELYNGRKFKTFSETINFLASAYYGNECHSLMVQTLDKEIMSRKTMTKMFTEKN